MIWRGPCSPLYSLGNRVTWKVLAQERLDCYKMMKYSILQSKQKRQAVDQQLDLLRGVLQHEFLRLDKLRDHALSRSAPPLSRAAPARLCRSSRSRVDRAHDRAHHPPLGGRRRPEKKKSHQEKATTQKGTKTYSPVTTPSRNGTPLPSPHRLDEWIIHPHLDVRRRLTCRRTYKIRFNCDQIKIQRQIQIRIQGKRSKIHT